MTIREKAGLMAGAYLSPFYPGGVFIDIPESDLYYLQVEEFDAQPLPTQIELAIDLSSAFFMEAAKGDFAWRFF